MEAVLIKMVNMSIIASYLALAVMVLRLVLKKAPRWIFVALWAMVGLRLVLPFTFESAFSAVPNPQPIPQTIVMDPVPQINSGIPILNSAVNPYLQESFSPAPGDSANPMQIIGRVLSLVWLAGVVGMALYAAVSYGMLRKKVREAMPQGGRIYLCDRIPSPFILGLFSPKIYLPSSIVQADIPYVVAHEKAHIQRFDHIWKPLGFALLSLYWFNPILWVAYILLCRDIESACDEKVLKKEGAEIKKAYCSALLNCSVSRRAISACPLAFGEVGVRQRIKNVLNYKRPAFWVILIALVASIVLGVCLLTDPVESKPKTLPKTDTCAHWISQEAKTGEITLEEFPGLTFRCNGSTITMEDGATSQTLAVAATIVDAWFFDATGDGRRDLCVNLSHGSGRVSEEVMVWDIHSSRGYRFCEELVTDYHLAQVANRLHLQTRPSGTGEPYADIALLDAEALMNNIHITQYPFGANYLRLYTRTAENPTPSTSITLPEYPGLHISARGATVSIYDAGGQTDVIIGTPFDNIYLCDVTGDGKRDICATVSYGSGMVDLHIEVYDIAKGQRTAIWDRGETDYRLQVKDFQLWVQSKPYVPGEQENFTYYQPFTQESLSGCTWEAVKPYSLLTVPLYDSIHQTAAWANFPNYLNMDVQNGLTIYVWQMAAEQYSCVMIPDKDHLLGSMELLALHQMPTMNLEETKAILTTYGLSGTMIKVALVQMPYSSYIGPKDDAAVEEIRQRLGLVAPFNNGDSLSASSLHFSAQIAATSWCEEDIFNIGSLYPAHQVSYLPLFHAKNPAELEELRSALAMRLDLEMTLGSLPSFNSLLSNYDEAFFQNHTLLIVYAPALNEGVTVQVNNVNWDSSGAIRANIHWTADNTLNTRHSGRLVLIAIEKQFADATQEFTATYSMAPQEAMDMQESKEALLQGKTGVTSNPVGN